MSLKHATLVLERTCLPRLSTFFRRSAIRSTRWHGAAPSDTATFVVRTPHFREGGHDVFRCGAKANPQFTGLTTYLEIVPQTRIVTSEVIEAGGRKILISLLTSNT